MGKLKSTFGQFKKTGFSSKKTKPARDLIKGGITALLGVALLSETASAVRRI